MSENTDSYFDKYRVELNKLGLTSMEDLEKLVKPLIRKTTRIVVNKATRPPENSQLNSHFGGHPYFEKGEDWPTSSSGKHMDFIFQIFNKPGINLPDSIALIQFYYDWEESAWDTCDNGWKLKIYKNLNYDKQIFIEKPIDLRRAKYCEITFKEVQTLPDWEGIDKFSAEASNLSCVLNEDKPWYSYDKAVSKLVGEQNYQSQLGGYPNWVQGESTPIDDNGDPLKLLFQIDSEDNAGLMWGDVGLIYVFYDEECEIKEFVLQCH